MRRRQLQPHFHDKRQFEQKNWWQIGPIIANMFGADAGMQSKPAGNRLLTGNLPLSADSVLRSKDGSPPENDGTPSAFDLSSAIVRNHARATLKYLLPLTASALMALGVLSSVAGRLLAGYFVSCVCLSIHPSVCLSVSLSVTSCPLNNCNILSTL